MAGIIPRFEEKLNTNGDASRAAQEGKVSLSSHGDGQLQAHAGRVGVGGVGGVAGGDAGGCSMSRQKQHSLSLSLSPQPSTLSRAQYPMRGKPFTREETPSYDDAADADADDDEEILDLFESICAYCDNKAENLLDCQGRCMRSFHPTQVSGANFVCESLGYSQEQTNELRARGTFLCDNCKEHMHQCFACGLLGSSNNSVFRCFSATCAHFYHPGCVSKLLHPDDEEKKQELSDKIGARGIFTCPLHKCFQCMSVEDSQQYEMQFAVCRRCPRAYHRRCLPSDIKFESDEETQTHQRAWEGRLPQNRVLIYCMDHEIIPTLATPRRDHLEFPVVTAKRSRMQGSLGI